VLGAQPGSQALDVGAHARHEIVLRHAVDRVGAHHPAAPRPYLRTERRRAAGAVEDRAGGEVGVGEVEHVPVLGERAGCDGQLAEDLSVSHGSMIPDVAARLDRSGLR
jgi:hypothetical protein